MAICPVCKTECFENIVCSVCGFSDINRIFINRDEANHWEETVLIPYKNTYFATLEIDKTLKISGDRIVKYLKRSKIKKVIIPDYITRIAPDAFKFCDKIKEIYIPDSVSKLPIQAFIGCLSLEKIHLSETITEIPDGTFFDCINLKEIHITKNIKYISGSAFEGCKNLRRITLDDNNRYFKCVSGCLITNDGELIISEGNSLPTDGTIKKISGAAFHALDFKSIVIPEGVIEIDSYMISHPFHGCDQLKELILPETLEYIGVSAISGCRSLKEIHIPKNVSQIMEGALTYCGSLSSVEVDKENKKFYSRNNHIVERETKKLFLAIDLNPIPDDGSIIGIDYHAYEHVKTDNYLIIPRTIRVVDREAFYDCEFTIFCEHISMPTDWDENWVSWHKGNIYWRNEWHYENGIPVPNEDTL